MNGLYGETFIVYNPDFQKLEIQRSDAAAVRLKKDLFILYRFLE